MAKLAFHVVNSPLDISSATMSLCSGKVQQCSSNYMLQYCVSFPTGPSGHEMASQSVHSVCCSSEPELPVQVFRTEHHTRKLGSGASLSLMAVVLLTIFSMSAAATMIAHPQQVQNMAQHPAVLARAIQALTLKQLLPVFWTGLCSTDAVLLIEVSAC